MYNIVTVSAQCAPLDLSCGVGWVQHTSGDSCYKFNETLQNWDDSRQACLDEGDGADMVSIHSEEEMQFVLGMYNVLFRVCLFCSLCIWIFFFTGSQTFHCKMTTYVAAIRNFTMKNDYFHATLYLGNHFPRVTLHI